MVKDVLKYYVAVALRYKKYTLTSWALAPFARIGTDYITPLIVAHIINEVSGPDKPALRSLIWWVVAFFIVPILSEVIWRIVIHCLNRSDAKGMEYIANRTFSELMNRSHDFYSNNFAGGLVAKTNRFINAFEPLNDAFVFEILGTLTGIIFAIVVLFNVSWPVAAVFCIVLVIFALVTYQLSRRRFTFNTERAEAESLQTAQLADSLSNAITVKTFAREVYEVRLFKNVARILSAKRLRSWDYQNLRVDIFTTTTIIIMNTVALAGSLYAVYRLGAEVGTVFLILSYIRNLTSKFWDLSRLMRNIETNISNAVEMMAILKQPSSVLDGDSAKNLRRVKGHIVFDNVAYSYNDTQTKMLFEGLNLDIIPGQRVGLVGPSGGGKSTITKLLLRFMDIRSGLISIDGVDIKHVTQQSLRDAITYVPQEPILFHRTLRENIAYGKPTASLKEIVQAAKKAHAHEFIESLADGYDTLVGERGIKLSGGQRQRVALARAFLKNAPIVVLDEATSALDSESEKLIQEALVTLMEGRTTIIIAHRLSTIKHLDRIIVLDGGRVVEDGTHEQLIKKGGSYASLWSHQSGGFIE